MQSLEGLTVKDSHDFNQYQHDPVAFGENILGEEYTLDVKTLMRAVCEHPVTIARSANAVGKTHAAARIALWWYKCFSQAQVYTAAAPPEANLKKLLWGEIGGIVEQHPDLFENDTVTTLHIARSAQSFITGVTIPSSGTETQRESRFAGKHAPHLLFVLDEADAIPDEVFRAIESCMSGGHARMLVMFNPRSEVGEVARMERDGRAHVVPLSALAHPNVASAGTIIAGAVTRETTIRRIHEWCRPLAEGEQEEGDCFLLPDYLIGQTAQTQSGSTYPPLAPGRYKIVEPAFSYMVLGRYPAQSTSQLISRQWIAQARQRWDASVAAHGQRPPENVLPTMGLDVGEFGSDANVVCLRYGGFVSPLVAWGGVDTCVTGDRAADIYRKHTVSTCNVDATGLGAGVAPHMQRLGCSAVPVKVAAAPTLTGGDLGEFSLLRDQLWWLCREWLRTDPGAMLPPDEQLAEELACPTYEIYNGKIRVMKKQTMRELLKRSPDRADALCLTFYARGFFDGCF